MMMILLQGEEIEIWMLGEGLTISYDEIWPKQINFIYSGLCGQRFWSKRVSGSKKYSYLNTIGLKTKELQFLILMILLRDDI